MIKPVILWYMIHIIEILFKNKNLEIAKLYCEVLIARDEKIKLKCILNL